MRYRIVGLTVALAMTGPIAPAAGSAVDEFKDTYMRQETLRLDQSLDAAERQASAQGDRARADRAARLGSRVTSVERELQRLQFQRGTPGYELDRQRLEAELSRLRQDSVGVR